MRWKTIQTAVTNLCSNLSCDLSHVVEGAWVIREDGRQIAEQLNRQNLLRARVMDHRGPRPLMEESRRTPSNGDKT